MPDKKEHAKKNGTNGLGRALMNRKYREARKQMDPNERAASTSHGMGSVTQETDVDEFINTAQLAEKNFITDRTASTMVISENGRYSDNPNILTPVQEQALRAKQQENRKQLQVPRRPPWTRDMKTVELDRQERGAFLEWRRDLADLQDNKEMLLTPFERNLEVWRQLWRTIERSDVVVQIVDSRTPLTFRCEDLENYVSDSGKRNLLLMNKADYLTKEQRITWAEFFGARNVNAAFYSAKRSSDGLEVGAEEGEAPDSPTRIISVQELEDLFVKNAPRDKEKVTIGLVGYPNVGKSSTINSLLGAKKVSVSSTPGKTKHFQTLDLSPKVMLCDCPGLVFPQFASTKADLVCDGVLPIDQLRDSIGPVSLVASRIPVRILSLVYGVKFPDVDNDTEDMDAILSDHSLDAHTLLATYAASRGFFASSQGGPDKSRAARIILKDYVNGKLLFCKPPPGVDAHAFNRETHRRQLMEVSKTATFRPPQVSQTASADATKTTHTADDLDDDFFGLSVQPTQSAQLRSTIMPSSVRVNNDGTVSHVDPHEAMIANMRASVAGKKSHRKPARQKRRG